jgi:hypothetical protein
MNNVICIKWGTKYGPHYVNRLYGMVRRNLSGPFRFVCLTDDPNGLVEGIETLPIPEVDIPLRHQVSPWRKLALFSPILGDLTGKALFLDLDILIVGQLDEFFTYSDKFTIIENWTQRGQGIGNSSVYCFEIGKHADVLEYYTNHTDEVHAQYSNEQIYLSKKIGDIAFWPEAWCKSFKFHAIPKGIMRYFRAPALPLGCRILVFHGHPNPDEAIVGDYRGKLRKYYKPAPWIADYWKE